MGISIILKFRLYNHKEIGYDFKMRTTFDKLPFLSMISDASPFFLSTAHYDILIQVYIYWLYLLSHSSYLFKTIVSQGFHIDEV